MVEMKKLGNMESFWIKELRTVYPYGLNDRCNGIDWSNKIDEDIACLIFNKFSIRRNFRSFKKINKFSRNFDIENFLNHTKYLYEEHENWIFYARKTIASLSKQMSKKLLYLVEDLRWNF